MLFVWLEAEQRLLGNFLVLVSTQGRFAGRDCSSLPDAIAICSFALCGPRSHDENGRDDNVSEKRWTGSNYCSVSGLPRWWWRRCRQIDYFFLLPVNIPSKYQLFVRINLY